MHLQMLNCLYPASEGVLTRHLIDGPRHKAVDDDTEVAPNS